ncbi:Phosphorelay intermediate protein [Coemansia sp. 'formosensis']|nr:Phosphorelay intermediate protein [Coemansia sp. 'formosensis']
MDSSVQNEDDLLDNEILDLDAFNQLLSMDDENDEEYEFSRDIVYNYFEQAITTFADMDKALHIQFLGKLQGANGDGTVDENSALDLIEKELKSGKLEYKKAEEFLRFFYESDPAEDDE